MAELPPERRLCGAGQGTGRPPTLLRSLMKKSDVAGGLQLASHLAAIACSGTGLWLTWGSWWGVPFFAAHGMLINWLYAAQHEASHDTVFRRRWMNECLGRMTGFILIYPRDHDRWQHLCHHRHTQDPELDSELVFDNSGRFAGVLSLSGLSFWRGLVTNLVKHAVTGRRASSIRVLPQRNDGAQRRRRGAPLASRRLRPHRRALDLVRLMGSDHDVVGPDAGHVLDAPDSEHHRAHRHAIHQRHLDEHPHGAHEPSHALAGLADGLPYRPPHLSGRSLSPARRTSQGHHRGAWRRAGDLHLS